MKFNRGLLVGVLMFGVATLAEAGPAEDAEAAYRRSECEIALRLARPLAAKGDAAGQWLIGLMHGSGKCLAQDDREAQRLYRLAARQGNANAFYSLGGTHALGQGVSPDYLAAYVWLTIYKALAKDGAENLGVKMHVNFLEKRLDGSQIVFAQRMAKRCLESSLHQCVDAPTASLHAPSPGPKETIPAIPKETRRSGTGFFVSSEGHLITNHHVIDGCVAIKAADSSGATVSARVVQASKSDDLALLKADIKPGSTAVFRDSNRLVQGETVIAYGYPLSGILDSSGNVSTGLITALSGSGQNVRQMQISAAVQPGNSGGPLVDSRGAVIGVVVSKLNAFLVAKLTDDIPQNINFAIKAPGVTALLEASGVDYKTTRSTQELPVTEITRQMKAYTVLISCN
jgi:S1-C subfamily serine protease